jgi:hypothetical protein
MKTINMTALCLLLIVAATVAGGYLHGRQSNRWGYDQSLLQAAQRLQQMPRELGGSEWLFDSESELPDSVVQILECQGYINRQYRNAATGERVRRLVGR